MATQIQTRRGTAAQTAAFTGAIGEVTADTTDDRIVLHDGSTAGGHPMAREDETPLSADASPTLAANLDTDGNQIICNDGDGIIDENGNEQVVCAQAPSAVNHVQVGNAATGNAPSISSVGTDANPDLDINTQGTGEINANAILSLPSNSIKISDGQGILDANGNEQSVYNQTTSAVNHAGFTNAATGNAPGIGAEGGDTNVDFDITGQGTGTPLANGIDLVEGRTVQVQETTSTSSASTTTVIPLDNTIPQITEGAEYITVAITAKVSTSKIQVEVYVPTIDATAENPNYITGAVFVDADAGALAATCEALVDTVANWGTAMSLKFTYLPADTSAHTLRFRFGPSSGTAYMNAAAASHRYSTAGIAFIRATEVLV